MPVRRPYGAWSSPISAQRIAAGSLRLSQPALDGERVVWLEGRPAEGGRQRVVAAARPDEGVELSPPDRNVRARVHEYGGGDFRVDRGRLVYVDFADPRLHAPQGPLGDLHCAYADPVFSPDGRWLVAVEEAAREGREPENRLRAFPLAGGEARALGLGHDFVSAPRFSPDGRRLAYTAWEHPDMPWDGTVLFVQPWSPSEGPVGEARAVAGGPGESIVEPGFSPEGALTFVSDRSGWWNLHQERDGRIVPLCPMEAEFGRPPWVFGLSSWAFVDERTILCRYGARNRDRLARLDCASGRLEDLDHPGEWFEGLSVQGDRAVLLAGGPEFGPRVETLDLRTGRGQVWRRSEQSALDPAWIARPEEIAFESAGGRTAFAFFYPPTNPDFEAPEGERPPLLVQSHGGPTAAAVPVLDGRLQFWTSRGFAVVDVNYGGSTGYGRGYRERLDGQWGVVDVEDCVHAARHLARAGRVDPERLAIRGGSAGGYTTLCALTFHDVFRAGASHYGIGDLAALARDTHKFESRYTDRLVAPWPEGEALYAERSPLRHADRLSCPVIFFQGLEDRVVPPSQAEAMVAALARRGLPHAYVAFPGEGHGFRRAENVATALEGELWFYSRVFGFEGPRRPRGVELRGG